MGGTLMADREGTVVAGGRAAALEHWSRVGFWVVPAVAWVVMVAYMWDALTTLPGADRLEETRMAVIPTPRTFFAAVAFSAVELGVVLAALWPWRPVYYTARLAATTLGLATWFVMTIPMGLSRMDWVHRRWLFIVLLATASALAVNLMYRLIQAVARRVGEVR